MRYIVHHGIKGQEWGVRRYQHVDGTLTEAGKKRYSSSDTSTDEEKKSKTEEKKLSESEEVVNKVIRGDYGNGADRVKALTEAGYDYDKIQGLVNKVLAGETINWDDVNSDSDEDEVEDDEDNEKTKSKKRVSRGKHASTKLLEEYGDDTIEEFSTHKKSGKLSLDVPDKK